MKPASISVLVPVPLAMTKFRRFSVCFPLLNYGLSFFEKIAGFGGFSGSSES